MKKDLIISIIVCIIVGGASFFGGMKYQASQTPAPAAGAPGGQYTGGPGGFGGGRVGRGGANGNGGIANGEVLSKDSTGLTLKLRNGGSQIIFVTPTTKTEKTVDGTMDDLAVGKQVMIIGTTNSDGSLTAQSIQLRSPVMFGGSSSTFTGTASSTK